MAQRAQVRGPAPVRVVWDGQSHNRTPHAPDDAPTQTMRGLPGVPWANVAISGVGWESGGGVNAGGLAATAATRRDPQARNLGATILVMNGGQGDATNAVEQNGQADAQECYDRATRYRDSALLAGFDAVLICTWPALGPNVLGTGRPSPSEEAAIDGYRSLLFADAASWDGVVDLRTPPLDDGTDLDYYAIDRTHLTPLGAQAAADLIRPALSALIDQFTP